MADLSEFTSLPELRGTFVARKASLRCSAITLQDGTVCLYSPVAGLGEAAKASLAKIGEVSYLFAPNHYHNKGIAEYGQAFPNATICTTENAMSRLEEVTGLKFDGLSGLQKLLPKTFSLVEPEGLKTGEVWIAAGPEASRVWFVVDAFGGVKMTKDEDRTAETSYLKTFPNFGVRDKTEYKSWVESLLDKDKPSLIVPCHGAIMENQNLSADARHMLDEMFG